MDALALLRAVLLMGFAMGAGLIFLFAGAEHRRHRRLLVGVVGNYRLLPDALVGPAAGVMPWAEIAVGLMLLAAPVLPLVGRLGALAGGTLLVLFGGAMAVNLWRGRGFIDCGCGHAALRQPLSRMLVGRNLVLAGPVLCWAAIGPDAPRGMALVASMAAALAVWGGFHLFNALAALQSGPLSATLRPVGLSTRR